MQLGCSSCSVRALLLRLLLRYGVGFFPLAFLFVASAYPSTVGSICMLFALPIMRLLFLLMELLVLLMRFGEAYVLPAAASVFSVFVWAV